MVVNYIEQQCENCRQNESQIIIRQYRHTNYSLHLNECHRDELIHRHTFRIVKSIRNDPETVILCSQ